MINDQPSPVNIKLSSLITKHSSQYHRAKLEVAIIKKDREAYIIRGRILFDKDPPGEDDVREYGDLQILHLEVSSEKGFEFI